GTLRRRVIAWAGPWPVRQRWWSTPTVSVERVQLITEDQQAWVLAGSADRWWIEARYDEA
ncbi:MAG: DNA polymerase Y family protein, partial [Cutibacterium acnes]|nr:DNA polymerase Y family protein [Cutibacterium acnes]